MSLEQVRRNTNHVKVELDELTRTSQLQTHLGQFPISIDAESSLPPEALNVILIFSDDLFKIISIVQEEAFRCSDLNIRHILVLVG